VVKRFDFPKCVRSLAELEARIVGASVSISPYPGNRDGRCNTLMHV
jgi:hypothetical protein